MLVTRERIKTFSCGYEARRSGVAMSVIPSLPDIFSILK